jgi:hypothetical protein
MNKSETIHIHSKLVFLHGNPKREKTTKYFFLYSVWGFFCTNPWEQLSGEISTHLVPQLGLGDERLLHTILVLGPVYRGRFDPAYPEGLGAIPTVGFCLQGHDHQFEGFSRGLSSFYICLYIGTSRSHRGHPVIQ